MALLFAADWSEATRVDTMERYRIQESIRDVITILDSAPIRWDLVSDTNIVQITNRLPIAHLAIERGLKALIKESGGELERTHSLGKLYGALREFSAESADYLEEAFEDAVRFFGYNVNRPGFRQFRSLSMYLSKVGTEGAFEELRYWAIGESIGRQSPIPYISLPMHRELLCALECLFLSSRRKTVSARVEREVHEEMFSRRHIGYSADDTQRAQSVHWYMDWLRSRSPLSAFEEAFRKGFAIADDEFITQTLRDACAELQQSEDPAVRYYLSTLAYLPKGSERQTGDAISRVQWIGKGEVRGMVVSPAGTPLGSIERYANGAWGITPLQGGLVHVAAIAWTQADAKHYLVNRLTCPVTVAVNGEARQLRIVGTRDSFRRVTRTSVEKDSSGAALPTQAYVLSFWDSDHGVCIGDDMVAQCPLDETARFFSVVKGTVISVEEQTVSVAGDYFIGGSQFP